MEEERRLCYVGVTRAKERLYLTCTTIRRLYGSIQYNAPSRFVDEIPADLKHEVRLDASVAPSVGHLWERDHDRGAGPRLVSVPRRGMPAAINPYSQDTGAAGDEPSPYLIGVRVRHPVWGVGTIQTSEGVGDEARVVVRFQSAGTKKLAVKYARLEVVH
jgi:DNA helicase-2/ATP-dependent DNA helicase PcrA